MDNIILNIKQSFYIFYQNRRLIYPSLFILLLVIHFSFYSIINISQLFFSESSTSKNSQSHLLRFLNQISSDNKIDDNIYINENEILSLNLLESVNSNITELALYYEFVQNITYHSYYGRWDNFNIDKNNFIDKTGDIELNMGKKKGENYLFNLNQKYNNSNISVSFVIKDGEFIDNYIVANFSFNFKDIPLISNLNKDNFSIILPNISMGYAYGHYMDIGKKQSLNNTYINMTFYKKPIHFLNKITHFASSTDYSLIDFHIKTLTNEEKNNEKDINKNKNKDDVKNFEIFFTGKAYGSQRYPTQILNYSILLTIAAFIEIYFCTKFLLIINENVQMALNVDLYTIFMQIMWSALICGVNFFLSLTYEPLTYEYGMPSMIYFALFSIFLLRILFIGWKSRYMDLLFNDMAQFRKKLFRFYLIFYCLLFCTLISIKIWYTYFIFTFFLFVSTWIFQIYHSAKNGTKPPMPYSYIFIASLFKMLIPIYLKAYDNNIFSLRPSYFKVFLCVSIVLIEAIIVSLQKLLGPKFFIPRKYRQLAFDYYKSSEEIPDNIKSNECVICLENLDNLRVNMEEEDDFFNKDNVNCVEKLAMMIQKWNKVKNVKPYMKTPCAHIFHSRCLETWLEVKNECPYCRQRIPPLEI
jgi:hypothetical protein